MEMKKLMMGTLVSASQLLLVRGEGMNTAIRKHNFEVKTYK